MNEPTTPVKLPYDGAKWDATTMERLISQRPIIVRRRVLWGECDPAGVVYTPRFADYAATAYFWFKRIVLPWEKDDPGASFIMPMKALALEFKHVLKPDELFDMTVMVKDIRERTFELAINARSLDGEDRFVANLTPAICSPDFRSMAIPAAVRAALLEYQQCCMSSDT